MRSHEDIRVVTLISEDAIGPVTLGLVVTLMDGTKLDFEGDERIRGFSAEIRSQIPRLADLIERQLDTVGNPSNYELVLFDRTV